MGSMSRDARGQLSSWSNTSAKSSVGICSLSWNRSQQSPEYQGQALLAEHLW